jgi:hypothetical protein
MTLEGDAKQNSSMIGHLIDDVKMFFFDMFTQKRGGGIRISNLRFIKRGSSHLNYLLETMLRCA